MILSPYVPEAASLHEATYVYLSVERAVLGELSDRVVSWAENNLGRLWHKAFVDNPINYAVKDWKAPGDPFFILKAFAKIPHTPLLKALGPDKNYVDHSADIFHARNLWAHYSQNEQMSAIKEDIFGLVRFAEEAGFDTAKPAEESLTELVKLTAAAAALKPVPGKPVVEKPATATPAAMTPPLRPRIGSPWMAELPSGELELNTKQRDVLDPHTGVSVKDRWPSQDLASAAIGRWLALKPTTPRLRFDETDGATIGFIEGYPFLFGYVGEEPETPPEQFRGFLGNTTYVLRGKELKSQGSRSALAIEAEEIARLLANLVKRGLGDGEAFRLSNYNDLVHLSDQGPVRVATLSGPH
jgi:hypothetical protein